MTKANTPFPFRLVPGLPVVQRDPTTWQIGIDPPHAVVVRRVDADNARGLRALDPGRHRSADPADLALLRPELLAELVAAGVLRPHAASRRRTRGGLQAESTAAALRGRGDPLPARAKSHVVVDGTGRTAALIATSLAAAGVGTVTVTGSGRAVTSDDLTPSGPFASDVRRPWSEAVADAVRSLGATATADDGTSVDVAVLTQAAYGDAPWCDPAYGDRWVGAGTPHLATTVAGRSADIGPIVLQPGVGCLRCRALRRGDTDPAWPGLALGLSGLDGGLSDLSTTLVAAGLAAARVLDFLDTGIGATTGVIYRPGVNHDSLLAYDLPPHAGCGCSWDAPRDTMAW